MSIILVRSSSVTFFKMQSLVIPAQLTKWFIATILFSCNLIASCFISSLLDTSQTNPRCFWAELSSKYYYWILFNSFTLFSRLSLFLPRIITLDPWFAKFSDIAAPIPFEPPETIENLPKKPD